MANDLPRIVLKRDDSTQVEVYLHGATVTSWKCKSDEILFVSKQAVFDGKKAIRGGIPVVFPNFGPWSLGPQHGFARTQSWKVHKNPQQDENGDIIAVLLLEDNEELRKIWNYTFKVWYTLTLKECEFSMGLKVENTGDEAFEFTSLLHTYYQVSSISDVKINGLKDCDFIDKVQGGEHKESTECVQISRNVDSIYKSTPPEHTLVTGKHNIRIKKENFPDTVIWNPWADKAENMSDFGDNELTLEDFTRRRKNYLSESPWIFSGYYVLLPLAKLTGWVEDQKTIFIERIQLKDQNEQKNVYHVWNLVDERCKRFKVKETVIVSLKEAREILDSTSATTIEDVKSILSGTRRKRSQGEDLPSAARSVADQAVANIETAIGLAKKKIRSAIALAVSKVDIGDDSLKTEAVDLLQKVLTKRSVSSDDVARREIQSDIQIALSAASAEVETAMREAVSTSIQEYKRIMDYFAPLLKELFQKNNLKGDVDQGEQDIEQLAIKASVDFVKFYDLYLKDTIATAVKGVEQLLLKLRDISETNPNAMTSMKSLLELEGQLVSEVVVETTKEPDEEIRLTVMAAAEKMLKDYQTVEAIIKKSKM